VKKKDIIILSTFFDKNLINDIYHLHQGLEEKSYLSQIELINNKNYFSRINLNKFFLNHYDCFEIFLGADKALNKLFYEENISCSGFEESLLKLIEKWNPKIIIFRDIGVFSIDKICDLKKKLKLKFKTILLNGFPIRNFSDYSKFDVVIFRNPWLINKFKYLCKETKLIYHCFNSDILKKIKLNEFDNKENLISFDGSSFSDGFYGHKKRYFYLYYLINQKLIRPNIYENNNFYHKLTYYLYLISKSSKVTNKSIVIIMKMIAGFNKILFKKYYKKIEELIYTVNNFSSDDYNKFYRGPLTLNFKNYVQDPNFGVEYYQNINNSKISLNIHAESMGNTAANIRLFEITGMQSCLLTEDFENLSDLFEKDHEVITYKNYDELSEKITFLKQNSSIAKQISENGHKKVLKYHTDKIRFPEYLSLVKKII